jgi:hypothetical protein
VTVSNYQVKGSNFGTKFAFVRERFGEAAAQALTRDFAPELGVVVLDSAWYPFAVFDRLLTTIAERHLGGDVTRLAELGEFSAQSVLASVYRVYGESKSIGRFLERLASLHGRFYNQGKMTVETGAEGTSATIELSGAPSYSAADLHVARGFYLGAVKHFGFPNATCRMRAAVDRAMFDLKW